MKCGAEIGWRRSVGLIVRKMKKYYIESRKKKKYPTYWIVHILSRNCLPKHGIERKTEGRMEVKGRRGRRRK